MMPNPSDAIYVGIVGLHIDSPLILDKNIFCTQTYAHIFGHFMAAFKKAEPGMHSSAPWKPVGAGITFDITAEMRLAPSATLFLGEDIAKTIWLITALMRLAINPEIFAPAVSNVSFSEIATSSQEPSLYPIEVIRNSIFNSNKVQITPDIQGSVWIRNYLAKSSKMFEQEKYATMLLCLEQAIVEARPSLALMTIWGALERLFAPSDKQELAYRTALNISAFLLERGEKREETFYRVKKLYSARSKAAHGSPSEEFQEFFDSYNLLREIFFKITEDGLLPTQKELDYRVLN